jgi:hypothetical protein
LQFLNEYSSLLEWLGFLSVLTFIGSLIAIPWIIAKLPVNYFIRHRQLVAESHSRHPLVARLTFVLRNFVGIVFLIAGIVMLVLPGQGIITILIGISFMDFPKKHHLVDFLVRRQKVINFLNWIRKKEKKPVFEF